MARNLHRRDFLRQSAAASASLSTIGYFTSRAAAESKSPNEKLHLACIGVANRASANIAGVQHETIVALCDIDERFLGKAAARFPKATRYHDFRKLLDKEQGIDAVVVSTADHTHAPATMRAMKLGKHVYCEKPLTHTVSEARRCAETAKKMKLATQMGTQIHAGDNYRRVVEKIRAGMIGPVHKVHCWVGKGWGGGERPEKADPVPATLHWDLWLGPAPKRAYAQGRYHPEQWRRWWDFGGGTLGDMACHIMDLPFWALDLRHPTTVAAEGPPVHPETCPLGLKVTYQFPARGDQPAVEIIWYDGNLAPKQLEGVDLPGSGVLFVGSRGMLFSNYSTHRLLPESEFAGAAAPEPTIPNSIGHYQEWITACKTGSPTTCNFDYSGALTETVLLGNVAYRTGQQLQWDPVALRATNCPEADHYLQRPYRPGWEL